LGAAEKFRVNRVRAAFRRAGRHGSTAGRMPAATRDISPRNLLKDYYLSFINKKYLTNRIDWFILCAMNANEISPKASARLNRIKIVSRIFRTLIGIYAVMLLVISLWALMDSVLVWLGCNVVPGQSMTAMLTFSPNQTYALPYHMSLPPLFLGTLHFSLIGFGAIMLNRLFKLYERSCFFAADNVRCIKVLGLVVISDGLVQTMLELLAPNASLDFSKLFIGGLIMLIAWIMDEGRKIQEEQELTV
jgi:Protein of unknown function (DUF2975)